MTDQELRDLVAENTISIREIIEQIKEIKEWFKEVKEAQLKTDEQLRKTISKLDWMWVTQWDISEDIFKENIEDILMNIWKKITTIRENVKISWKVELDMVCVNWTEVFVVEVKTRLTTKHINKFLETSLPRFRKYCHEYKKFKLYWMVAWRTIPDEVGQYANKKWLYVLKQMHNWNAKMLNNKDFQAKEYIF